MIQFIEYDVAPAIPSSTVMFAIYLFHMPLFMLISGYFAANSLTRDGVKSLGRYARRLILPCVTFAVIRFICFGAPDGGLMSFLREFLYLWFLVVLFECVVCYYVLMLFRHPVWRVVCAVLPMVVAMTAQGVWPLANYFTFMWPFFLLGCLLRKKGFQENHISPWSGLLLIPLAVIACYVDSAFFVYYTPLAWSWHSLVVSSMRIGAALVGCCGVLGLMKVLYPLCSNVLVMGISRATLALYVMNVWGSLELLRVGFPHERFSFGEIETFVLSLLVLPAMYGVYRALCYVPGLPLLLFGEGTSGVPLKRFFRLHR